MTAHGHRPRWVQNIAYGLRARALLLLSMELLRQICRRKGLAEAHFGWPAETVALVGRQLADAGGEAWLCQLTFVVTIAESPQLDVHRSPLGRIALHGGPVAVGRIPHLRRLHPGRGLLHTLAERPDVSWLFRKPPCGISRPSPVLWRWPSSPRWDISIPRSQLAWRLHAMLWLLLGLLVGQAFALRCLLVAPPQIGHQAGPRRRAAAMAQAHAPALHLRIPAPIERDAAAHVDLISIDLQTRRLLRSFVNIALFLGCWLIWIDVLPALGILDRFQLWSYRSPQDIRTIAGATESRPWPAAASLGDVLFMWRRSAAHRHRRQPKLARAC